jgi:pimeloyl-ACP methyl ester carboxylesterase
VAGILDKLNVKEACVVGHSYGEQRIKYEAYWLSVCAGCTLHCGPCCCLTDTSTSACLLPWPKPTCIHTYLLCGALLFACAAGTFIAGMLARHHRKRVHTLCLIDPVCFGMFMPHLLYNFLYRVPVRKGWSITQ